MSRIHQLDNQLANQIAAGEVVERPASVVKELVENSVDAGASRVEVDIERGGARLIRVVDDGNGIHKDDLPLALSRHATSKIHSFDDLCAVKSMGFRGEALASIASVAKLLLRSRQSESEQGWQAVAEGRDMAVKVAPAAATQGTCIEVRDLFFNTPARRKFLRTEKTEFTHIEDTIKREALAHPGVAFVVKHNGKISKRYPAVNSARSMEEKLKVACGQPFVRQALKFSGDLDELKIHGWLASPDYHRSESDAQFIFVNGRPVKDRLLSHAIRQSYSGLIPQGRFASYVIYIECPPQDVDVNVHPTKHEVRFRQPRQVHDFLVKLLQQCLSATGASLIDHEASDTPNSLQATSPQMTVASNVTYRGSVYSGSINSGAGRLSDRARRHSPAQIAEHRALYDTLASNRSDSDAQTANLPQSEPDESSTLWQNRYLIAPRESTLWLIDVWQWLMQCVEQQWDLTNVKAKPLLVPKILPVEQSGVIEEAELLDNLKLMGIELTPAGSEQVMLRKLPALTPAIEVSVWQLALQRILARRFSNFDTNSLKQRLLNELIGALSASSQAGLSELGNACESAILSDVEWRSFAVGISESAIQKQLGQIL